MVLTKEEKIMVEWAMIMEGILCQPEEKHIKMVGNRDN